MINIKDVYISDDDLRALFDAQALSRAKKEFEKMKEEAGFTPNSVLEELANQKRLIQVEREKALDELAKIAQEENMGYETPKMPANDFLVTDHDSIIPQKPI